MSGDPVDYFGQSCVLAYSKPVSEPEGVRLAMEVMRLIHRIGAVAPEVEAQIIFCAQGLTNDHGFSSDKALSIAYALRVTANHPELLI